VSRPGGPVLCEGFGAVQRGREKILPCEAAQGRFSRSAGGDGGSSSTVSSLGMT
jgi:hypothetical protein